MKKKILSFVLAVSLILSIVEPTAVQAAQTIKKIKPTSVADVEKIYPSATISYPAGTANKYNYTFQFTLSQASKVRITGLSRYTFWNWNGDTKYTLTNSLVQSKATVKETWSTYVNADHSWDEQAGNYCDNVFILNKGTYYLSVNTTLCNNWRDETYSNYKTSDFDLGFWLSVTTSAYTKTPKLKSLVNKKGLKIQVKYSKVKDATGYCIQYSTSKKFKKAKSVTSTKATVAIKKSLKKKKTYYVRVRAYRLYSGNKYYSTWSNVKKVKVKK